MRIRYSISTMVFWWREHHLSFEQECDYLKHLGFGIEIWPTIRGHNDCRYVKRNWSRLKEATSDMQVSLKSRDDGPTIDEWDEQLQCAKTLDACVVANLQSLCISDQLGIADWGFVTEVAQLAEQHGVTLCIETGSLPALLQVGEKFDSIRYCLDTGYAHLDANSPFEKYIDQLAERTTYIHLTDNYGKLDDHEPPGVRGGMDNKNWDYLLETLSKYDNDVTGCFEMFPSMPGTMIRQGCKFMFDTLKWPDRPQSKPGHDESAYRPL